MKIFNKKYFFLLSLIFFANLYTFAGTFYTATLYPKENTRDVKEILSGKKFFICSKADEYNLVTEEKMDMQDSHAILDFVKKISLKTEKPVVSYMIHDSDVLWFVIYKSGKQIFLLDNSDEYFSGGKFVLKGKHKVPSVFKVDQAKWNSEITKEKFEECLFADEFLAKLLNLLKLPEWVAGIGYRYLSEDKDFVLWLKKSGVNIEKD